MKAPPLQAQAKFITPRQILLTINIHGYNSKINKLNGDIM